MVCNMVFVQGPIALPDEQAFVNFDSESLFSCFDATEKPTVTFVQDPASDGLGMRISGRRNTAHPIRTANEAWVPSKNYVSEQKRRKKLNNSLLELRALVPKITKMDKASIIGDTITYLKELGLQIEELEKTLEVPPPTSCSQDSGALERFQVSALSSNPSGEPEVQESCRNSVKSSI